MDEPISDVLSARCSVIKRLATLYRVTLREALLASGIQKIEAPYDGSGDSGWVEEISYFRVDFENALSEEEVNAFPQVPRLVGVERHTHGLPISELSKDVPLDYAITELFLDYLEALQPGWEIEDGSCGVITWDVVADKLHIYHQERVTEFKDTEHNL